MLVIATAEETGTRELLGTTSGKAAVVLGSLLLVKPFCMAWIYPGLIRCAAVWLASQKHGGQVSA
jgi:hypothetical protein